MLELTIGSRFYYQNQLYEVKKGSCSENNCIFDGKKNCSKLNCDSEDRHDKKDVYYSKADGKNNILDSIGKTEDLLPVNQLIEYDGSDCLVNKIIQTIQYIKKLPVFNYESGSYFGNDSLIIMLTTEEIIINFKDIILFDSNTNTMKIFRANRIIKTITFEPYEYFNKDLLRFR